jgi:hypothetical protein
MVGRESRSHLGALERSSHRLAAYTPPRWEAVMRDQDPAKEGRQKGAQEHAEGQHGEKTHARFLEELQSGHRDGAIDEEAALRDLRKDSGQGG